MQILTTVFGPPQRIATTWNPVIVVRHGIFSDHRPFQDLENFLAAKFPKAKIDNHKYEWKDSVVMNGTRLADSILGDPSMDGRPLVLIGHSMGGLVCRVANLILSEPDVIQNNLPLFRNYCVLDKGDLQTLRSFSLLGKKPRSVNLMVTLATPNSGAMLWAQINSIASIVKRPFSSHVTSMNDLTTERLFRLLQYFSVNTPTLSISGSGWNRFGKAPAGIMLSLAHLAGRLHLPNDMIVEDRSVDLDQSILKNEILSAAPSKYLHLRLYRDCIDVVHDNIYDHGKVRDIVVDCITRC
jgi:pimeloyl-ACP methyl ester carboxylesterase